MAQEREPDEARKLLDAAGRVIGAHRLAEALDLCGGGVPVEAKRRRQADRVRRAVRRSRSGRLRLGHRVPEPEARAGQRRARVHRSLEQRPLRLWVVTVREDERKVGEMSAAPARACSSASWFLPSTYSASAQWASAFSAVPPELTRREVVGELRLIDDALDAAPPPPPLTRRLLVADAEAGAHSAPEYVVGTETTGSRVAAETAFAVSIALPPPSATRPSAPSAATVASARSRASWGWTP